RAGPARILRRRLDSKPSTSLSPAKAPTGGAAPTLVGEESRLPTTTQGGLSRRSAPCKGQAHGRPVALPTQPLVLRMTVRRFCERRVGPLQVCGRPGRVYTIEWQHLVCKNRHDVVANLGITALDGQ